MSILRGLPVMILLAGAGTSASAQGTPVASQQLQVTADIPAAAPTGSGVRDLAFGPISLIGAQQTIDVVAQIAKGSQNQYSAEFASVVAGAAGIQVRIAAPSALPNTGNAAITMPVTYAGTTHGAHCWAQGTTTCASTLAQFDPGGATTDVTVCRTVLPSGNCKKNTIWGTGATVHLYIGGALTVAAGQPAGTYAGTITMTLLNTY